jgi:hypothetical protein
MVRRPEPVSRWIPRAFIVGSLRTRGRDARAPQLSEKDGLTRAHLFAYLRVARRLLALGSMRFVYPVLCAGILAAGIGCSSSSDSLSGTGGTSGKGQGGAGGRSATGGAGGGSTCGCTESIAPVCGTNGVTYPNLCEAECAGVPIEYGGACGDAGRASGGASGTAGAFGEAGAGGAGGAASGCGTCPNPTDSCTPCNVCCPAMALCICPTGSGGAAGTGGTGGSGGEAGGGGQGGAPSCAGQSESCSGGPLQGTCCGGLICCSPAVVSAAPVSSISYCASACPGG